MMEEAVTARLVRQRELRRSSIHDQETARTFGFGGALVPGIDVMAWLMNPLCDLWGSDWVERGTIELKNIRPVYDGEQIVLRVEPAGMQAKLEVVSPDGAIKAVGSATVPDAPVQVNPADYPFQAIPEPRLQARPGLLAEGQRLGSDKVHTDGEFIGKLQERTGARHPALTGSTLHPLAFQQCSTWDSMNSLEQESPGIHVWGETINLRAVRAGAELASAGTIRSVWERKGNHYMKTEQLVTADGEPAALVRRDVIFSLAKVTG